MGKMINLEKVIGELANGNQAALEELFNYYYPRLYNFSRSFLKLEEGIDDILQEVFIKIWQNRQNIKTASTFESFIFTITRNLLLNELRSRLNNQKLKDEILKHAVSEEYSTFEPTEYNDIKEKVENAINELPDRQKEIFILSRTEGLSYKEIAEKLNISPKTVEYHIAQVTRLLKKKLSAFGLMSLLWFYLFF